MELTRRDAVAALAAAGVATAGVALDDADPLEAGERDPLRVLQAVAHVVYPSDVSGVDAFVRRYLAGRLDDRPAYREGVLDAVALVDARARTWYDAPAADLDPTDLDALLREIGADRVDPDPDGSDAERVRFFVVNELLYALYSTPTGGELVGIENPQGHPGGTDSYQRGPDR
jgi:hypothetical protein